MSQVVAVCPSHGSFASQMISISNSTNVTLAGDLNEPCPRCGAASRVMEGTFNFRDDLVEVLSAPGWTREVLGNLTRAVQRASDNVNRTSDEAELNAQIDELSRQITAMSEDLGHLVQQQTRGKSRAWVKWFLGALCTLLMWLYTAEDVEKFNTEVVGPMIEQVLLQNPEP